MATRQKTRADVLLVERGLAESRERAQALIMEGVVFTPAGRVAKSGSLLSNDVEVEVRGRLPYVSRGGFKLAHALDEFGIDPTGMVALDIGASTGGFTDCLLQRGAVRVYAIDVGHGQLAYTLRQDPRVVCFEKLNARLPFQLPEPVDLLVIDVSFISLTLALPQPLTHLQAGGYAVALIKPQFEARRGEVGRGGVGPQRRPPRGHSHARRAVAWRARRR
ncbi:Putative rRNA methyltransferase YqxC [Geodia barretti]|uniref:rRNA methyltransferase YqxC n=1 Tax=Geodia barretti TaxID=519541 RepID=A0AA35W7V2_GEOBA|nr:Putative rRNA methyltransferase YqxC [Geodia barretti]